MDPNSTRPEEYGRGGTGGMPRQRPPRDPLTADFGQPSAVPARTARIVSGDHLLTVNPVDGSELEVCPPGERPERPVKYTAQQRAERARAARPPAPAGPDRPETPPFEPREERERLVRLLARGRSVRLTGPAGSGRSALLDAVAEDCTDIAPDGVVRLTGFHRTAGDLLHDLFTAVYDAPLYRPERDELLRCVQEIGAVVVLDDLEIGGGALDELLDATPECAFLLSATPEVPAPSSDAQVEEVFLGGLDRAACLELLERAVERALTDEEVNWAGDLWFESEGLPLRFAQAGALLRQHDRQRAEEQAVDEFGVFQDISVDVPLDTAEERRPPLPSLAEAAAAATLLASHLSASARETLKFAVALGGEVPQQTHLPALLDETHADATLAELVGCALVSPVGSRYRLAAGVLAQLEAAGYADDAQEYALKAARHYAWWAGHPSVTPERVSAEADALLAALTVMVPLASTAATDPDEQEETSSPAEDEENLAVLLARQAAPAFAAGLHWSAWERALRSGVEAARLTGSVAEQGYFHHELGILALCCGQFDRARAELEASIGLRGALADKRGTIAGRRALTLVADRSPEAAPEEGTASAEEAPGTRSEEITAPLNLPAVFGSSDPLGETTILAAPLVVKEPRRPAVTPPAKGLRGVVRGTRRNLVAAGAGAALVAVLGTVVTLGMTSDNEDNTPSGNVQVDPATSQDADGYGLDSDPADEPGGGSDGTGRADATAGSGTPNAPSPTDPGPDGTYGTADDPTPSSTGEQPPGSSHSPGPTRSATSSSSPTKTSRPTPPASTVKPPSTIKPPTQTPPTSPPETDTEEPPETPTTSDSASGPATSVPATTTGSASAPVSGGAGTPSGSGTVI
ncbi:ATP-binding protein [Streptomyces nodosus]